MTTKVRQTMTTFPQTAEEAAAGVTPTLLHFAPGDVRRYGAVGDGVTNDAAALQAGLNTRHPVVFQNKTYYIATGLTWTTDYGVIHANGAILLTDQDIIGLTVGALGNGNIIWNAQIHGYLYLKNTHASPTKQGFLFRHAYEGKFEISTEGWHTGVELQADYHGTVYNDFHFGRVYGHKAYGVYLKPSATGWVNENNFYGGRFGWASGATASWHIYMPDSGSTYGNANNNKFFGPSLEAPATATVAGLYCDGGYMNLLFSPRIESSATMSQKEITITADATCATILFPYESYYHDNGYGTVSDNGKETFYQSRDRMQFVSRQSSPASPVMSVWREDGNNDGNPLIEAADSYNESQSSMGILLRLARDNGTPGTGYALKVDDMGTIRLGADGRCYECILTHTSSAADEPGVGANWTTYWRLLPTRSSSNVNWAVSTAYTGNTQRAIIKQRGDAEFRNLKVSEAAEATSSGDVMFGASTQTTVGTAGTAAALPAQPSGYLRFFIGPTEYVLPYYKQA